MQCAPTITGATRGCSGWVSGSRNRRAHSISNMQDMQPGTPRAMALAPAKPASRRRPLGPHFGSTPPEAYFRPDRRTSRPTRAAAVMDGRHANGEACAPLPGRSLMAASTAAQLGGSGPEGADSCIDWAAGVGGAVA